ncbi:MAG TPA: hypothetical protein VK447_17625 [Myxococcaceae bacterium]|nr:hypothetical protein [Myxococcaceae bacterium]
MNRLLIAALVVVAASGCGSPLSENPQLTLSADIYRAPTPAVRITLESLPGGTDCPTLSADLAGTVNGRPMKLYSRGGTYLSHDYDTGGTREYCAKPVFEAELLPGDSDLTVTVTTAGETATATFVAVTAEPTLSWVDGSGDLTRGQQVRLSYSVPTDTLDVTNDVMMVTRNGDPLMNAPVTLRGQTLEFTVPRDAQAGEGNLYLSYRRRAQVSACQGISGCELVEETYAQLPASLR